MRNTTGQFALDATSKLSHIPSTMKKLIAIMALAGITSSLAQAQAPTQPKDAGQPNVFTTSSCRGNR